VSKRDDLARDRRSKREQEAAERLSFLEKLVLRALHTRQVPAESGVRFAVSSKAKDDGICLVFLIDDPAAPIVEDGPRPDYLVVHVSQAGCLMTIVEMKGSEQKNLEHGIEQIRAMYRRLREELGTCLPGSWRRARIQGVLLMPENAQLNRKKIEEARAEGIEILPLGYHHQAELYPYVSKPISRTERYKHEKLPRQSPELNEVEQLITEGRLTRRIRDAFFKERRGDDEDTFFLSFRCGSNSHEAHMSVSANTRDAVVAFSTAAGATMKKVESHLEKHGLACRSLSTRLLDAGTAA
jgi:hypothetical protein